MNNTKYHFWHDVYKNTTIIKIIYKDNCVFTLEFTGQLQACAIREYAIDAVQLLIDKGVIK